MCHFIFLNLLLLRSHNTLCRKMHSSISYIPLHSIFYRKKAKLNISGTNCLTEHTIHTLHVNKNVCFIWLISCNSLFIIKNTKLFQCHVSQKVSLVPARLYCSYVCNGYWCFLYLFSFLIVKQTLLDFLILWCQYLCIYIY